MPLIVGDRQGIILENLCPRRGAPLHNGTLECRVLRCSRHGIAFDPDSGRALDAACSPPLRLTLAHDGDRVGLDL
ncbi:Rieske 2Fe-2S domain-containing protein [Pseudomonas sp. Pc102]|uniref:Rieske (2Fe-2S) protein n=1 Tax=Pseudomonas sp. Pc102 TaxID=2678261 RepID=UPI001FD315F6|nr:Rieske 2Fe-2S domain-containing protein [Pseudomonas sp. Pc102]